MMCVRHGVITLMQALAPAATHLTGTKIGDEELVAGLGQQDVVSLEVQVQALAHAVQICYGLKGRAGRPEACRQQESC